MEEADDSNVDRALDAAASRLDLSGIATGPSRSPGLGATFAPHHLLGSVLQQLRRFPGKGVTFLIAGLRSPVVRNRNMALRAAAAWGQDRWPKELTYAIEQGSLLEPDEDVRRRFSRVAAGEPFEEPNAG
jgi:hypothetical protein